MSEVERERNRRVEGAEHEREQAFVAGGGHEDPDGPEPLAEEPDPLREGAEVGTPGPIQLGGEQEAGRRLPGPALEELFTREPVSGRVQLDGREALRVVVEEAFRLGAA